MRKITVNINGTRKSIAENMLVEKKIVVGEVTTHNGFHDNYLDKTVEGKYVVDTVKEQELEVSSAKSYLEAAIDSKIQDEINIYNEANKTLYKSIDAIPKYLINPDYTHYAFCLAVSDWNIAVWEKARAILDDVNNGLRAIPSEEQLLLELPVLTYG